MKAQFPQKETNAARLIILIYFGGFQDSLKKLKSRSFLSFDLDGLQFESWKPPIFLAVGKKQVSPKKNRWNF